MEDIWARQALHERGEPGSSSIGEAVDAAPVDDPLGDEAAFPSTWQQLAPTDAPRD